MLKNPSKLNHHANLLVGELHEAELYLENLCRDIGVKIANNPDVVTFRTEIFGIEEARQLSLLSTRKPIGDKKFFLILSERLTAEAQNALLKTFEDPSPETYFFLAVREAGILLPTLLSRMQVINIGKTYGHIGLAYVSEAEKFVSLSIKERLVFSKKFVDPAAARGSGEAKDEKNLSVFLDELLLLSRDRKIYDIIISTRDSYASPRLVLEHLSVVL